jgi:UDP-N-acetylglucosamine 2-epimerase (non-hydrolysing)
MKILTLLGTRPEIIRLSRVIPRLDSALGRANHILVHTGQNYDAALNHVFFEELNLRATDYNLGAKGTFAEQLAIMFPQIESILLRERPDRFLVLGDTNSSMAAIVAARLGIPVYHMEAGNRSFSPRSPEEVNRRLIDHASTVLLPYTERSRANLLAEGIHSSRVMVTGNPIWEVVQHYGRQIDLAAAAVRERLSLEPGKFFLVTLHRAENVDDFGRLGNFIRALDQLQREHSLPVIVSTHSHLRARLMTLDKTSLPELFANRNVRYVDPLGFFDFLALARSSRCVLSDSGTVQEECSLLHTPMVCLRDYTERPECLEAGASVLSGADIESILSAVKLVTERPAARPADWSPPAEYLRTNVSETVTRILLGHLPLEAR